MTQIYNFTENTLFLCKHKALKLFTKNYAENYNINHNKKWSIICERKEDIVTVRNQIFLELEAIHQSPIKALSGISIYTLDTLAQKICASLAHTNLECTPASLLKPYLDITNQEKIVELILNLFGYNSNDSLALAKQILTLIDIPLPQEITYIDLLMATQENSNSKTLQTISEISIKQILATIQQAKIELANYARFQTLINECLNTIPLVSNTLLNEILSSHLLWIGAPEYQQDTTYFIKPGNYQQYLVNDFKKYVLKLHTGSFYDSRTLLNKQSNNDNINIYISNSDNHFFQTTREIIKNNFVILGDFDAHSFQTVSMNGDGAYAITKKDLENWKQNIAINISFMDEINKRYDEFLTVLSYVQSNESLQKIAEIYGLNTLPINEQTCFELFVSRTLQEKIVLGDPHPLASAPKALSFFNSTKLPEKIICIGNPHDVISKSFNVKILNQVFFFLQQKGVDIEIPATEAMYRLFWQNLVMEAQQIDFWLAEKKEIEQFPNYIKISKVSNLNNPFLGNFNFYLQEQQSKIPPNWKIVSISITQFEDYVFCPHKFFLKNVLNIKKEEKTQSLDFKDIGIKMHKICEQFITRLVILLGNVGYVEQAAKILNVIINILKDEKLFLSFNKQDWLEAIKNSLDQQEIMLAFSESIDLIWGDENKSDFLYLEQREILKRTFLKFLQTELENLKKNTKLKIGLYRELPIQFELEGMKFIGRIDRIDLTTQGLEIIDYKTSNLSKTEKEITLSPSSAKENTRLKLSIQGALYTYGFAKNYFVPENETTEDFLQNKIASYSLYFLKNLDINRNNCLQYDFSTAFSNDGLSVIENEYKGYVQNLLKGEFSPRPIQGDSTCMFCEYKSICPKTYSN